MAEDGYNVKLNIYDLSRGLARQLSTTFLGKAIEAIWCINKNYEYSILSLKEHPQIKLKFMPTSKGGEDDGHGCREQLYPMYLRAGFILEKTLASLSWWLFWDFSAENSLIEGSLVVDIFTTGEFVSTSTRWPALLKAPYASAVGSLMYAPFVTNGLFV